METFLFSSTTREGYKFAVGGICKREYVQISAEQYKNLELIEFGKNRSEYFIDYMLSKYIKEFSTTHTAAVGATLRASEKGVRCGGIIGNPFIEAESADGQLEVVGNNIYSIAIPDGFGVAFESEFNEAKSIHEKLLNISDAQLSESVFKAVDILKSMHTFILASDGSGEGSLGAIYTSGQGWCIL